MIPRDSIDGQRFLALYNLSDQPYEPRLHWNTNREWVQDPLYIDFSGNNLVNSPPVFNLAYIGGRGIHIMPVFHN